MVRVTDRAARALQELRTTKEAPPDVAPRLVPDGRGGLGMTLAAPQARDEVIRRDETPLLAVDREVAAYLADLVVDYQGPDPATNGQHAAGFVLRPPRGHE
jgi:Fe-S cluster assembly iron-binding protein IscA